MKTVFSLLCLLALTTLLLAVPPKAAKCDKENCKPPNCRCSSREIPGGLTPEETPQFVLLTFDDAINVGNIDYYRRATLNFERKNPDGCVSAMTFFLSHDYTDYGLVHELYKNGQEIAMHTISHTDNNDQHRNEKTLQREFSEQRNLTAKFANIPFEAMQGLRIPFLKLGGDVQFDFMENAGFMYDSSWPTQNQVSPGLWPYTLDYASSQECKTDENCPMAPHPGIWEIPMLSWRDMEDRPCAMVDACVVVPKEKSKLIEFMKTNFLKQYETNKAPTGFFTHASWFSQKPIRFEAYLEFLNYLSTLDDVYIVTIQDLIKWMRNPIPLSQMKTSEWSKCRGPGKIRCKKKNCELKKPDGEEVWFAGCMTRCPVEFPWTGNIFGDPKPSRKKT